MTALPMPKMSLAEFMAWENEQPTRHEFYRGEVFAMVGGAARHNRVIGNLMMGLTLHLDGSPCQVYIDGMKLQLAEEAILYPDLMVTCNGATAGDEQVVTDPKLVIEVLSPSTKSYDQRSKFALYRTLPSLREYVLIEPSTREVEVFRLTPDGWLLLDQSSADEIALASIDCKLAKATVFKYVK